MDGSGEFLNELNPKLRLYDATGQAPAEDDDSGDDGVNARLNYPIPAGGGTYYLAVLASDAALAIPSVGEYVLNVAVVEWMPGDPPVANDDRYTPPPGQTLAVAAPGVLANDAPKEGLSAELVTSPSKGTLSFNTDGSFNYQPDANSDYSDAFTYVAYYELDGQRYASEPATVTIIVEAPVLEYTFASTDVPKSIADLHPVKGPRDTVSQLVVTGTGAKIASFRLDLTVLHDRPTDLSANLRSPSGTEVVVFPRGTAPLPTTWATDAFKNEVLDGTCA